MQGENEAISKPMSFAKIVLGLKPGAGKVIPLLTMMLMLMSVMSLMVMVIDHQVGPGNEAGGGEEEANLEDQRGGRFASLVRRFSSYLSDPGVPGVRSMGPFSLTHSDTFLKLD